MPDELCAIPPPFLNARYGNLQTLPRPTAKPTQVRMNSTGFDHSALCNMTSHQLTIVSVDSYAPVVLPPIPHFIWSPLNIITFFLLSLSKSTFDFCTDCLAQIQSVGKTGLQMLNYSHSKTFDFDINIYGKDKRHRRIASVDEKPVISQ